MYNPSETERQPEVQEFPQGEALAILDAGAQYGQVIDRRIRELRVKSEILPLDTPADKLRGYRAIIITGGPESVYDEKAPAYDPKIFSLKIPILGICYGMQLMNYVAGGGVERNRRREDGPCEIKINNHSLLFRGLEVTQGVLMSHGDSLGTMAEGFRVVAESNGLVAAIENPQRRLYGVQFHPEVDLTAHGKEILRNFLYEIAGFSGSYTLENREERAIAYIKETVGEKKVLVLVSGGVDSTVCATLLIRALGSKKVFALHIDNGFMRLDESAKVAQALARQGLNLRVIDASKDFYSATTLIDGVESAPLCRTTHPEIKRKIIGDTFMRVAEKAMQDLGIVPSEIFLAQGTLRPDLIESASSIASGKAHAIKTHHNDTRLVRELRKQGRVVEPLRDYHKDEVRLLGRSLGLPEEIVARHPFPGPGLAIRIICADKPYMTESFVETNQSLRDFTPPEISATLLPIQTVGVQGDARTYSYAVGLSGEKNWSTLFRIARELPKLFHDVNRVVYIFGERVQGPVTQVTPTYLTKEVITQLQQADNLVNEVLLEHNLARKLSQVPVISFPVNFGMEGKRSIGIRTFITNDFMTGVPAIPGQEVPEEVLEIIVSRLLSEVPGISRVVYDLTSKPPGTTEWE